MYFPVGSPAVFRADGSRESETLPIRQRPRALMYSPDGKILCIINDTTVYMWNTRPLTFVTSFARSIRSMKEHGANTHLVWRRDSQAVAITTKQGFLLVFRLMGEDRSGEKGLYRPTQTPNNSHISTSPLVLNPWPPIAALNFRPHISTGRPSTTAITHQIKAVGICRNDILVSTTAGVLERVSWDEAAKSNNHEDPVLFDASTAIVLANVKFKKGEPSIPAGVHVVHMRYCNTTQILAIALSDGTAAVLTSPRSAFDSHIYGTWVPAALVDSGKRRQISISSTEAFATRVCVNARFRLVAVGTTDGDVHLYNLEHSNKQKQEGAVLSFSHSLSFHSRRSPMHAEDVAAGHVSDLGWSPDGYAIAVGQATGGLSVWSVFGSLLMSTTADNSMANPGSTEAGFGMLSLSWGPAGYHLVCIPVVGVSDSYPSPLTPTGDLFRFHFVRSALTTNACLANQYNVMLLGEDRLYLNPDTAVATGGGLSVDKLCDDHWQAVLIPSSYMDINWPIRIAAVDPSGSYAAVAGLRGLAHYNSISQKWRMFGNEGQEQAFECVGIVWWKSYVVAACREDGNDEIRFYPRATNLDIRNVGCRRLVSRQICFLNVFNDLLIIVTASRRALVYTIDINAFNAQDVDLSLVWEVSMQEYVPHHISLVSVALIPLGNETAVKDSTDPGAMIVNVGGQLLMLSRESSSSSGSEDVIESSFSSPAMLATGVESYWGWTPCKDTTTTTSSDSINMMGHLSQALWLGCGGRGMQVWLPLVPELQKEEAGDGASERDTSGSVKRIMLPFELNVYPLSILFEDAVVLGASHEVYLSRVMPVKRFPYCALERKTQIYLHHILRQLLRRSHDEHALAVAKSCSDLPYFEHVLELMLHEVLEDEADQHVGISDAQLPRVAEFVGNFGSLLDTIVQCARKTEVAKWIYFFSIVGNPQVLFEECIAQGKLDTAASYLIILQSLESPLASREYAMRLIVHALNGEKWELAKDLNRFLQATASYNVTPKEEGAPKPNSVFQDHALGLLRKGSLRALGRFSANLGFPLVEWLHSIKILEGTLKDFGALLKTVSTDFNWNASCLQPCSDRSVAQEVVIGQARMEIEFLLNVFFDATCYEWAFVLCVMLQDKEAAKKVLEEVAADKSSGDGTYGLLKRFHASLDDTEFGTTHKEFVQRIATAYRSAAPIPTDVEREISDTPAREGECSVM
eukprot:m.66994 g.66994  ORF g.66994 m.66994 type:complete len:1199 (+) comp11850_c0_seq2:319-3915(+)